MKHDGGIISETDLLAHADGELDAERRAKVEAHLAAAPEDAAAVAAWRRQNEALSALYGSVAEEAVPARLDIGHLERKRTMGTANGWRMAAAAVFLLVAGGAAGWLVHGGPGGGPVAAGGALVAEALDAHALYAGEVVHPVEVRGDDRAHLKAWLSKRLDRPLSVPDLKGAGFALVGGRLLPAGASPAAQFMYEDKSGRRVTLYVVPVKEQPETAFRYTKDGALEAFSWTDEAIACAVVGDLPRDQLHALAMDAYRQLG